MERALQQLQQEVADILKGRMLIGHGLENDMKALMLTTRAASAEIVRTGQAQNQARQWIKIAEQKTQDPQEFFDWDIQEGEHSPVVDARAALAVYKKHAKAWERDIRTRGKKDAGEAPTSVPAAVSGDIFASSHKRARTNAA